jgi:hypothetical protein
MERNRLSIELMPFSFGISPRLIVTCPSDHGKNWPLVKSQVTQMPDPSGEQVGYPERSHIALVRGRLDWDNDKEFIP